MSIGPDVGHSMMGSILQTNNTLTYIKQEEKHASLRNIHKGRLESTLCYCSCSAHRSSGRTTCMHPSCTEVQAEDKHN